LSIADDFLLGSLSINVNGVIWILIALPGSYTYLLRFC